MEDAEDGWIEHLEAILAQSTRFDKLQKSNIIRHTLPLQALTQRFVQAQGSWKFGDVCHSWQCLLGLFCL